MTSWSNMTIHQDGACLGEVERVRIQRGPGGDRCAFDLSGTVALALDDDRPATLRALDGTEHHIRIGKRYYSNGSFRVNGFVEAAPETGTKDR
jgi:hypothetical protein